MNRDEAKAILLLYRPGTTDDADPQIAEALAAVKGDAELDRWFEEHCARQNSLRENLRKIVPPTGLREQIISEHRARRKVIFLRRNLALAAVAMIGALLGFAIFWVPKSPAPENTFAMYQRKMAGIALRGYGMDLTTDDAAKIRAYLAQRSAPADFVLPAGLQNAELTGCAVEGWQGAKVSMICFRSGRRLPPGQQNDVWLFIVNGGVVKNAPASTTPELSKVNRLATASWTKNGNLYFLGAMGDEQTIRKLL